MEQDVLHNLLRDADGPAPTIAPGLAGRIRQRAVRRSRRRMAVASVLVLFIAATLAVTLYNHPAPLPIAHGPATAPLDVAACRARIVELDVQARLQTAIADRIIEIEEQSRRLARARRILTQPSAEQQLQAIRDQTAMLLMRDADRLSRRPDERAAAAAAYRQAADLFPESVYAPLARSRLRELGA